MKKSNISIKKCCVLFSLVSFFLTACNINGLYAMSAENMKPPEQGDCREINKREETGLLSNTILAIGKSETIRRDGRAAFYFEEKRLEKVILWHKAGEEGIPWTVYGIEPGMGCDEVMEKLDIPGIKIVGHNLQYYATGIRLEDMGIQMLKWGADSPVSYVEAVFENSSSGFLGGKGFGLREEEVCYRDTNKGIDICVMYPVFEIGDHTQVTADLNRQMKEKAYDIVNQLRTEYGENITERIVFEVTDIESENISVKWSGTYRNTAEKEMLTTLNCSIENGCNVQKIADMGMPIGYLVSEISWRMVEEADILEKKLMEGVYDFYATPISLVVICRDESDHYREVSVMKSIK